MKRGVNVKIPCGKITGHGECCSEGRECDQCSYILELEKQKRRKVHDQIYFHNNDMWWSKDDVGAYDYLVRTNNNFIPAIKPFLKKTEVAVQAGGHCGWMIRELDRVFDYIYTFEPNHLEFLALCMNMPNENVFKFNCCVGNERKMVDMHKHEGQSGANFVSGEGRIPTLLIDDLNLNACDFVQIDTEGFEYKILLGARKTIEKFKPVLCIERYWGHRYSENPNEDLDNLLLGEWGYKLVSRLGDSDFIYAVE